MAIVLMLCASACFVSMAGLVKLLGDSLPLTVMMLLRSSLALPILFAVLVARGKPVLTKAPSTLLLRTLFGALAMYCFYYALTNMPLADCVFISRTHPLLIALLAPLIVRENPPPITWLAIASGLAGVALVMQPSMEWRLAALAAFGGAAASAVAHLLVRRLNRTDDPTVIVFNFTFLLAVISLLLSLPVFTWPDFSQWLILAGIALFASGGQLLLTKAYQLDQAPIVASASYSSIILSLLYGYLFWDEVPTLATWVGGLLIISGGITLFFMRIGKEEHAKNRHQ